MQAAMPFLTSFLLTALFTPIVIALAHRYGWVAKPRADRWHSRPTALMGGIGIFLGAAIAWLLAGRHEATLPIAVPAAAIFLLGVIDDRLNLRPHLKFIGQLGAAAALVLGGVTFSGLPPFISLILTMFWVVGITNAVNLLDNMDGLAAGVSLLSVGAMAVYCASVGSWSTVPAALALAGACAAFLIYNFNPARIFMGDCGSMFIGFVLAALAVQGMHRSAPNLMLSLLVPVAILAIPIFDTTLVSVARTLNGRRISQGGRDHCSHRLVALGLSERGTVLVLYGLTLLFGALALLATQMSLVVVVLLGIVLFTGLILLGLYLGFLKVYAEEARVPERVRGIGGTLLYKRQLLQVVLDMVLVPVAFVGAHLLRFEGELALPVRVALLSALPIVLVVKLSSLALCRAHRGVWRYAGMTDALTAAAGSTVGSLLTALILLFATGFKDLSRAALITDWVLFTILTIAARTGYVALRQIFGMLTPPNAPRVVILGLGSEAFTLMSRLRDPYSTRRAHVLGILDDDPGKQRRALNGVSVLGTLRELPAIVQEKRVSCCLLGVSPQSDTGAEILKLCREAKIAVYQDLDTPIMPSAVETRAVPV